MQVKTVTCNAFHAVTDVHNHTCQYNFGVHDEILQISFNLNGLMSYMYSTCQYMGNIIEIT